MSLDAKNAKKYADNIKEADNNAKDLKSSLKDILFLERDYAKEARSAADAVFQNKIQAAETAKAFRKASEATRDVRKELEDVLDGEIRKKDILKEIDGVRRAENALLVEQEQALDQVLTGLVGQEEAQKLISESLGDSASLQNIMLQYGRDMDEDQQNLLNLYIEQQLIFEEQEETLAEIERRAGNIDDAFGLAGTSAEGLSGVLNQFGLGSFADKLGIDDAVKDTRKFAAGLTDGGDKVAGMSDKFKVVGNLVGGLGKNLIKNLKDPVSAALYAVKQLADAFMSFDKQSGELAKQFGISAEEAGKLVERANDAAGLSGDLLVSTKDVVAAQQALNKQFGTAVQFSGKFAAEFASVQERTGLSAEAMGLFASNAMLTGTTIKDQLADVTATTMELNNQNGIALSVKDIQEGLAKTSKAALLTAGRNTKELANQVYQAKLLGVEQSKVEAISDSLLNFEDSIAKELEAELLIGKDLNLERARAAALEGDLATVAKEVADQVGTAADFTEMNVIQQDALAASVGMTREELAAALVNQEQLAKVQDVFGSGVASMSEAQAEYNRLKEEGLLTEEKQKELAEKGLLDQLESASIAEKFAGIQEKIQDLFMQIASALMPIVTMIIDILEPALNAVFQILNPILDIFMNILMLALTPIIEAVQFIGKYVNAVLQPVMEALMPPIEKLMNIFDNFKAKLSEIFGEVGEGVDIFGMVGTVMEFTIIPLTNLLGAAVDLVMNYLSGVLDIFSGIGDILSGDLASGFTKIGAGLIKIVLAPIQAGIDLVLGMINSVADFLGFDTGLEFDLINTVSEGLGLEGSDASALGTEFGNSEEETSSGGTPQISLATGGIVTTPTNALIGEGGEPEAVVPLSKAQSMGFGGNERAVELLERLVAAVEKGGIVELDGNKVGTALGMVSYKTQ